ncbi:hypothetical protein BCR33DRAFT_790325 [Rhizoclosmatium globosum]|uniref:Cytochrome b561 domain-containing protein n=1 Tax=Rhizoclosmatium globosum TaxID=329046 RepID=A0A1Y2BP84_9FUNG|nr:hypothetical protein HDU79_006746 [Rhizoclosmatium sp. JEL0117]ORY36561.1 hypothetical protein BCR33DRAFT_790325 [Rhizoclosmatium globosum]|eukprot:ORY36561.1 hypothetical protein BCR33DRAFT_790325 [Rhizoclosmatium globosum]
MSVWNSVRDAMNETMPYEDGTDEGDYDMNNDRLTVIHGALMGIAWVFLAPAAIAVARYLKGVAHSNDDVSKMSLATWTWFRLHYILFGLVFILNMIAFGLIYKVTDSDHFDVNQNGAHVGIGLFIWIAIFVQMALGALISYLYKPNRASTPWWDHIHHWFGRILFILCIVNIPLGINLYSQGLPEGMTVHPSLKAIYIVWVVAVAFGFGFMEIRRHNLKARGLLNKDS